MNTFMAKRANLLPQKILVDADALVALINARDSGHRWAKKIEQSLEGSSCLGYLTSFAYGETLTVTSMRMGLSKALKAAEEIEKGPLVIIEVGKKLRQKGLQWFARQTTKNARFTDCINMALMEELGIKNVFSRDLHYRKNGFKRLGID